MLCFETGAGSEALRKLSLTIKQLYKLRELDLLVKSIKRRKPCESKNFAYFGHKKSVSLHFLLLSYPLRAISDVFFYNCTTDHKSKYLFLERNYANAHNPRK